MAKKQLGAVDSELLARVDEARGDVSRVRWVERALEAALDGKPSTAQKQAAHIAVEDAKREVRTPEQKDCANGAREFAEDDRELAEELRPASTLASPDFGHSEPVSIEQSKPGPKSPRVVDGYSAATSGRHCERCKTAIPSPSLLRHPVCGGKVVPEP